MKPGPILVLRLPQSDCLVKARTPRIDTTTSAVLWTDGKLDGPRLPDRPPLRLHPETRQLFWVDDCDEIGRIRQHQKLTDLPAAWQIAPFAEEPSEADYIRGLAEGIADTRERQMALRTRLWWKANDARRRLLFAREELSPFHQDNIQTLADLLDATDPEQRLMRAEALRELGAYDQACALLDHADLPAPYRPTARRIAELAIEQNSMVAKIQ